MRNLSEVEEERGLGEVERGLGEGEGIQIEDSEVEVLCEMQVSQKNEVDGNLVGWITQCTQTQALGKK